MEKSYKLEPSYTITNHKNQKETNLLISSPPKSTSDLSRMIKRSHTNKYEGPFGQNKTLDNRLQQLSMFEIKTNMNKINKIIGDNHQLIDEDSPRK
jgi:hypothetical protein